jgi:hypothetical protein
VPVVVAVPLPVKLTAARMRDLSLFLLKSAWVVLMPLSMTAMVTPLPVSFGVRARPAATSVAPTVSAARLTCDLNTRSEEI